MPASAHQYDGLVSRHLNRRVSRPISRALANTPLTPNQATVLSTLVALAAAAVLANGWHIAAGILIHASSILDGVDGELARLKGRSTRLGAVLDAVADRYADAAIYAALTVYAVRFEDHPQPELLGIIALGGALTTSYSRARIEASLNQPPSDGIFGLASRDVRLLIAAIGTLLGQAYITLAILAAASWLTITYRLISLRLKN